MTGPLAPRHGSATLPVLAALAAGLVAGGALAGADPGVRERVVAVVEPVGTIWVNAIRMTVIPLVVALLVGGVAPVGDGRAVGRLGARSVATFLVLNAVAAAAVVLATDAVLSRIALGGGALLARGAPATPTPPAELPAVGEWLVSLLPTNPIAAAANGALLPLVVFTVLFAAACTRLDPPARDAVVGFFQAVADAMLVLVRWVLAAAPAGVFALALALGARAGVGAVGALATYVALVAALCLVLVAGLYAIAVLVARVPLPRLVRAAARAQAVAFSTRSSLAALPAVIDGARVGLRLPPPVVGLVVPLAMAMFRVGASVGIGTATLFVARLYGVDLSAAALATVAVAATLLSFSVPGVPGGVILVIAPVLDAVGVPAAGLGVLLAIDALPDMFRTLTNVTGHLVAATLVARGEPARGEGEPAEATAAPA
jgi:proton glutamate symport protein